MQGYSRKKIAEMKKGDRIEGVFSVHYTKPITVYKFGTMFEFRLADNTGQMTAKYWGGEDQAEVMRAYDSIGEDAVVKVRGTVSEYKNQMELAINPKDGEGIQVLKDGEYDIRELIPTREDIPRLRALLRERMGSVKDPKLSELLHKVFDDESFMEEFSRCPASIMLHSNELGGLIYHTLNVAEHCMLAWEHYKEMDRDLLLSGALLHDVGKVEAFKVTTNIDQTEAGKFLGHLVIGMDFVKNKIREIEGFPEELENKVLHIILSHHGKRDWGSPVEPAIPEALTVHYADDFDAKLDYMLIKRKEASTDDSWIWDSKFRRLLYVGDQ
ncbi:MAG: HD domain-containing protein [Thermoplasmata archaeon]